MIMLWEKMKVKGREKCRHYLLISQQIAHRWSFAAHWRIFQPSYFVTPSLYEKALSMLQLVILRQHRANNSLKQCNTFSRRYQVGTHKYLKSQLRITTYFTHIQHFGNILCCAKVFQPITNMQACIDSSMSCSPTNSMSKTEKQKNACHALANMGTTKTDLFFLFFFYIHFCLRVPKCQRL